ncbi:uncharacterized protein LOC118436316 [Folsomia candida]|uniref:uncharacterized protein LOC118436316 n=1 Tax=Folsomia candida TaxID=158441 RepID=UPI001604A66B|nr:uncharacterized protein LOC118436316 [Folsomia candida]XP_035710012.1 uncharacterized protein LOC118436316 [Folsomia candida]
MSLLNHWQALCCIFQLVTLMVSLSHMWTVIGHRRKKLSDEPLLWFCMVAEVTPIINFLLMIHFIWFKQHGIVFLCKSTFNMAAPPLLLDTVEQLKMWVYLTFTTLLALSYDIYYLTLGIARGNFSLTLIAIDLNQQSIPFWNSAWLLLTTNSLPYGVGVALNMLKFALACLILIYQRIFLIYALFHVSLMTCYIVKQIGNEIINLLRDHPTLPISNVMDVYKRLYALMRDINQAVSSLVFGTVLNALVHFSKLLLIILDSDVFMAQVATFIESAWVFLLLVCAAEGEENIRVFQTYLLNNAERYEKNVSTVVALENATSKPLGLKALRFTITHGLIVTVFSTSLTYFIIMLQLMSSSSTMKSC